VVKFIQDHWKVLAIAAVIVIGGVMLGIVFGDIKAGIGSGASLASLVFGWLQKSPSTKSADTAITSATRIANDTAGQVKTDIGATQAGAQQLDKLLDGAGATVAGQTANMDSGSSSLLDESKSLGKETS
jgi:hypothetical protein